MKQGDKTNKTNVMRLLDKNKIPYSSHTYNPDPAMSGEGIAILLNEEPFGMKKQFRTFIHETAMNYKTIFVSAGRVGCQIEIAPADLITVGKCTVVDITYVKKCYEEMNND